MSYCGMGYFSQSWKNGVKCWKKFSNFVFKKNQMFIFITLAVVGSVTSGFVSGRLSGLEVDISEIDTLGMSSSTLIAGPMGSNFGQ